MIGACGHRHRTAGREDAVDLQGARAHGGDPAIDVRSIEDEGTGARFDQAIGACEHGVDDCAAGIHGDGGIATNADIERQQTAGARVENPVVGESRIAKNHATDRSRTVERDGGVGGRSDRAEVGDAVRTAGISAIEPVRGGRP